MKQYKKGFFIGISSLAIFTVWTLLLQCIDVQTAGVNGSAIGFAAANVRFHQLTGVHTSLYVVTDWLGLLPLLICLLFGGVGFVQLIRRRHFLAVDKDILLLGIYYIVIIFAYLFFEMVPINYRPILIDGVMEASYPSSTTLLVLGVMPTVIFQIHRRAKRKSLQIIVDVLTAAFSLFMVIGRLIAGVHWWTDIVGAVWLSTGLFLLYLSAVGSADAKKR